MYRCGLAFSCMFRNTEKGDTRRAQWSRKIGYGGLALIATKHILFPQIQPAFKFCVIHPFSRSAVLFPGSWWASSSGLV